MAATVKKNYRRLRSGVLAAGFHGLSAWARSRGYPPTTVYSAARGERSSGRAVKIIKELEELTNA